MMGRGGEGELELIFIGLCRYGVLFNIIYILRIYL